MRPAGINKKISLRTWTPERKKKNIKYKIQIIFHCVATIHGQSNSNMVFNLSPLHDIVPNAEIIYFEE